jgi:secreted Zn-dependent insulinase-like peptidase
MNAEQQFDRAIIILKCLTTKEKSFDEVKRIIISQSNIQEIGNREVNSILYGLKQAGLVTKVEPKSWKFVKNINL